MITTKVFKLSRTELARMMSEEFIRSYWFFAVPVPICGLFFLIKAEGPLQALGMLMILWPFSIPARSVVFTTKSSRLFTGGCHVEATPDEVAFIGEYTKEGKRLRFLITTDRIKEVTSRNGFLQVRLKTPALAPIREDAFESEADKEAFLKMVGPVSSVDNT